MRNIRIRKEFALVFGLLASVFAFGAGALGATVVFGQSQDETSGDNHGPVTPRAVVAAGNSDHFGRWEIVSSQDAGGDPCIGVRMLDGGPDGGPWLAEGCGPTTANQVGVIVAPPGTDASLFFGRVDGRAVRAEISDQGRERLTAETLIGKDGRTYVLTEAAQRLPNAEVRLVDAEQRSLGRADPAAAATR